MAAKGRMKRRVKKAAASRSQGGEAAKITANTLGPSVENPPKLFVLPKDTSAGSRIVTIEHALSSHQRYFICPDTGFYEFTRVSAPKRAYRSWLLAPDRNSVVASTQDETTTATEQESDEHVDDGYVLQTPDLFVATPIDPLFIMLAVPGVLWPFEPSHYEAVEDKTRTLTTSCPHLSAMIDRQGDTLARILEGRIKVVCDELEVSDEEKLYVFSPKLLVLELLKKANSMVQFGLPASLEEKYVKQALEVPVLSIRREESNVSFASQDTPTFSREEDAASQGLGNAIAAAASESVSFASNSQDTEASGSTAMSTSTTASSVSDALAQAPCATPVQIVHLLRLRTALDFMLASYIPADLCDKVNEILATSDSDTIDFTPLKAHLAYVAKLKSEALALRTISDYVSRKRSVLDDEEVMENVDAKKRKKDAEEVAKKSVSLGVRKLMKADTSGMKKLSSFFAKAPATKPA